MLFEPEPRFPGLPREGFELFSIESRVARRHAILDTIHPALSLLGQDLVARLNPQAHEPLHPHLPRLNWPRGYEPFCTWLALSRKVQGYQDGPQLNLGVHRDFVGLRLGWDTSADGFGRFEFLCRHGGLGQEMIRIAATAGLQFRVYAAADWPEGSRTVLESPAALVGSFDEVRRRGVWWEIGRRFELPEQLEAVVAPSFGDLAAELFGLLLPLYERAAGEP